MSADPVVKLTIPAPPSIPSGYLRTPPETPATQARIRGHRQGANTQFIGVEFLKPLDQKAAHFGDRQ